jgi:hypothetical protein
MLVGHWGSIYPADTHLVRCTPTESAASARVSISVNANANASVRAKANSLAGPVPWIDIDMSPRAASW